MEIVKTKIQNFKSIVDSGEVNIESKLTILVGKNEQGKSNFLKALNSFNEDYKYLPNVLPNHLRPSLEGKPAEEVPIVTLWLQVKSDELEQLKEIIKDVESVKFLKAVKYYGNIYKFTIVATDNKENELKFMPPDISQHIDQLKTIATELKAKLIEHTTRHQEFGKNKEKFEQSINSFLNAKFADTAQIDNLVKTFSTGIRGLPSQDEQIKADIASATKNLEAVLAKINQFLSDDRNDRMKLLMKQLPKFILHRTALDKIPNDVNVAEFISAPEKASIGMAKLCRAAGLPIQKIQELAQTANASDREVFEDYYKGYISGGLNEFWTQEKYEVHFRIEKERLSVSISDGTYSGRIPPLERSDGFQWYLSFYTTIQSESTSSSPVVILLDNPALELHVDGQRDIKNFLEEKTASSAQVIYVTHSPAMVDPFKMGQIRTVELKSGDEGTKVSNKIIKEGEHIDILEPLRSAIGSSVGYSLMISNYNLLVEGKADKLLLEGILYRFSPEIKESFFVNGSLAESEECLLAQIYKGLHVPFIAVLDADSSGRKIASTLKKHDIDENNIIEIKTIFTNIKDEFALADLISAEMYYKAVKNEYTELEKIEKPLQTSPKIENAYEKDFEQKHNIKFSKARVAQSLKRMLINGEKIDKETNENLEKLAKIISKKLNNCS